MSLCVLRSKTSYHFHSISIGLLPKAPAKSRLGTLGPSELRIAMESHCDVERRASLNLQGQHRGFRDVGDLKTLTRERKAFHFSCLAHDHVSHALPEPARVVASKVQRHD